MKIAIDCRMIGMSGIGVYLENILTEIIQENSSFHFLLIGSCDKLDYYKAHSSCQIFHDESPIFSLKELFFFPVSEINKCDVFFTPNYNIPLGIKIPIFSTVHDVVFMDIKGLTSMLGYHIRKLAIQRALYISKSVFTVSNFSKERIEANFRVSKPLIVTYNVIRHDLERYIINQESPYSFKYILFVGNIKRHKGIYLLLEAYSRIKTRGFDKKLVIVGNCENFKTVDSETINLLETTKDDIVFTGKLSNEELYNVISHACLLVQPSLYEGFGIPPLEALFFGKPVVISDIPVFREIYKDLPVIYFDTSNIDDLVNKISTYSEIDDLNKSDLRKTIKSLFSQSKISKQILKTLVS